MGNAVGSTEMTVDPIIYYGFSDFRLDVENQQLLKNGKHVPLTRKAFQVLLLLVKNAGHTTTKADIFEQLWSDSFVEDSNLTQHVHVLRKVLGHSPDGHSYVETVPKLGYRFTLHADEIFVGTAKDAGNWEADRPVRSDHSTRGLNSRNFAGRIVNLARMNFRHRGRRMTAGGDIELRMLLVVMGAFLSIEMLVVPVVYYASRGSQTVAASSIRSVAILPFKPIGENVDREKLGFGMTDAVITNLSKFKQVVVRPTSSVSRYIDDPAVDVVAAGKSLDVDAVLEGTVQCDGEFLRVSVQLVRVADGKPLWADSWQEKMGDKFAMQDSISSKVALALSMNLSQQLLAASRRKR